MQEVIAWPEMRPKGKKPCFAHSLGTRRDGHDGLESKECLKASLCHASCHDKESLKLNLIRGCFAVGWLVPRAAIGRSADSGPVGRQRGS